MMVRVLATDRTGELTISLSEHERELVARVLDAEIQHHYEFAAGDVSPDTVNLAQLWSCIRLPNQVSIPLQRRPTVLP